MSKRRFGSPVRASLCARYSNSFSEAIKDEEAEANAKLIASAPELLEALKATKQLNLHLYEDGTVGNRIYKQITNAINKATK